MTVGNWEDLSGFGDTLRRAMNQNYYDQDVYDALDATSKIDNNNTIQSAIDAYYNTVKEEEEKSQDILQKRKEDEEAYKANESMMKQVMGEDAFNAIDPWERRSRVNEFGQKYGGLTYEDIMNRMQEADTQEADTPQSQTSEQTATEPETTTPIDNGADPETGVIPAGGYKSGGITNRDFYNESEAALRELFGDKYSDFGTFAFTGDIDDWRKFMQYGNIRDWYVDSGAFNENGDFDEEGYGNYFNSHRNGDAKDAFNESYAGTNAKIARQYLEYMARNGLGWIPGNDETISEFSDLIKKTDGQFDESSIQEQVDNMLYEYVVNMIVKAQLAGDEERVNQLRETFLSDLDNLNEFIGKDAYEFVRADEEGADKDKYNEFATGWTNAVDRENAGGQSANPLNSAYYNYGGGKYVPITGGLDPMAALLGDSLAVRAKKDF